MNRKSLNYLDLIPVRNKNISYSTENGIVKLYIKNKGFFHYITQKLCKKPTVSTIELEEIGSCIWQSIDEKKRCFYYWTNYKRQIWFRYRTSIRKAL